MKREMKNLAKSDTGKVEYYLGTKLLLKSENHTCECKRFVKISKFVVGGISYRTCECI